MTAPGINLGATLAEIESGVSAAVACDPILLRMMQTLRDGQADGMDASKFGRLLRLAIESAYLSGVQCGLRVAK